MSKYPRIIIAGLKGGSGKTTLSVGLTAALKSRGLSVTPFKKGPDYIDAGWLAEAAGGPCYNLDPFLIGEERIVDSFVSHLRGDIAVIEGNRGLYDGMDAEGSLSTANLAKTLKCPVVMILDCTKMTRTVAVVVMGLRRFDKGVRLGGVVLNQIAGARHEKVIRESIERYTDVPVLGAIPRIRENVFPERHMGLTPHQEHPEVAASIRRMAELIGKYVDVDRIISLAEAAPNLRGRKRISPPEAPAARVRIGAIRDSAFQFYYPENFEELERAGAEVVELSAIDEKVLPRDIDALYIGGGFPETHAIKLSKNASFRRSLLKAVEAGLPVYAECGGLMYLGESLSLGGKSYRMAGVFPLEFTLHKKPEAHGYSIAEIKGKNPFYKKGAVLKGHEFHYSRPVVTGKKKGVSYAIHMKRGVGIERGRDGICYRNVFATYTHTHALGTPEWAEGMVRAAMKYKGAR